MGNAHVLIDETTAQQRPMTSKTPYATASGAVALERGPGGRVEGDGDGRGDRPRAPIEDPEEPLVAGALRDVPRLAVDRQPTWYAITTNAGTTMRTREAYALP
jgi:hypothetical protein